jgi:hypothetical protein
VKKVRHGRQSLGSLVPQAAEQGRSRPKSGESGAKREVMSADRLPLLVAYGEGDDRYEEEEEEEVKADDFELRAMVDGHVLSHGKSERRPTTGLTGQAAEESSTPTTPAPAPRCLPTYVALAICMIILLLLLLLLLV